MGRLVGRNAMTTTIQLTFGFTQNLPFILQFLSGGCQTDAQRSSDQTSCQCSARNGPLSIRLQRSRALFRFRSRLNRRLGQRFQLHERVAHGQHFSSCNTKGIRYSSQASLLAASHIPILLLLNTARACVSSTHLRSYPDSLYCEKIIIKSCVLNSVGKLDTSSTCGNSSASKLTGGD